MLKIINRIMAMCLCVAIVLVAWAGSLRQVFIPEYESGAGRYLDKKTAAQRSEFVSTMRKTIEAGNAFYQFAQRGQGDYDKHKDIVWENEAACQEGNGVIRPVFTTKVIKDKRDKIIAVYEKRFDYEGKKVFFTAKDSKGKVVKKADFPIKGNITDDVMLIYFLKPYVAYRGQKEYGSFYLMSKEPRLYRVTIKDMGEETISIAGQNVLAVKLRLIPDMGLLTGVTNAVIPPTYVWYTSQEPYTWLQYEGLETGLGSAHIISQVTGEIESVIGGNANIKNQISK